MNEEKLTTTEIEQIVDARDIGIDHSANPQQEVLQLPPLPPLPELPSKHYYMLLQVYGEYQMNNKNQKPITTYKAQEPFDYQFLKLNLSKCSPKTQSKLKKLLKIKKSPHQL